MQEFLIIALALCATALIVVYKCFLSGLLVFAFMLSVVVSYFLRLNKPTQKEVKND